MADAETQQSASAATPPPPLTPLTPLPPRAPLQLCSLQEGERDDLPNLLLACTGSVASLKVPELVFKLRAFANVHGVTTEHAQHFFDASALPVCVYRDRDEWSAWTRRGEPVLHIELRRWAHCMLLAPLDANTLAKLASGLCDNLVTCVARAWGRKRPLLFAPAMNTHMLEHPVTERQVAQLRQWGFIYLPVISKTLICGDTGAGAMARVDDIVSAVRTALANCDHAGSLTTSDNAASQ